MISGAARVAGVIGWPVDHSKSPLVHGHWLRRYGIDGAYVPLPVRPEDLEAAVRALPRLGFVGANVTIPHKQAVLELIDEVDPNARRIGAVNTIVIGADGRMGGGNTDAAGFSAHLAASAPPTWSVADAPTVLLGAGGAARAACAALLEAGATEIRLINRTVAKAESIAETFGSALKPGLWSDAASALDGAGLLVNATSLGMQGKDPLVLDLDRLPPEAVVYDIVYTPLHTELLRLAEARGNLTVDGLGMLLHQARGGFNAWFGVDPQVDEDLRRVVLDPA